MTHDAGRREDPLPARTSSSAVLLRAAAEADAPEVAAIWASGWRDGHLGHVSEELVSARPPRSFAERAMRRVGETTVAIVAGVVAGFTMVVDDEVEQIYVAADHRGSGVAGALLVDAERRIHAAGHPRAWLAVVACNARARRFYERAGWVDAGPFDYLATGVTGPIVVRAHRYQKPGE